VRSAIATEHNAAVTPRVERVYERVNIDLSLGQDIRADVIDGQEARTPAISRKSAHITAFLTSCGHVPTSNRR